MASADCSETTELLRAWANGDQEALAKLTPRVYNELRRIAGHFMRNEQPGRTMQTTALVHEAYLKLIDVTNVDWQHRAHFFAVAAQIMRRILLDALAGATISGVADEPGVKLLSAKVSMAAENALTGHDRAAAYIPARRAKIPGDVTIEA